MRSGPDGIKLTAEQLQEDNFSEEAALLALLVWAQAESQVAATQITNTTSSIMDDLIADQAASAEAGAEFPLEDVLDELNKRNRKRSGTIGTTESGKGIGKGQAEAAEEMQRGQIFTIKKQWRSKRDFKVRDTHARANSRYTRSPIGLNEMFQVGSGFGLHPKASTLPAGEVIRCRCFARYVKVKQNLT